MTSFRLFHLCLFVLQTWPAVHSFAGIKRRLSFNKEAPKLILISGCFGTGKSTFGMSLALDQGILKCISTDTVRAVMRSYVPQGISPPLHRSSYEPADTEDDDPVKSWKETCAVLESSVEGLVDDAIARGVSLVLEGVSIVPSTKWIDKFEKAGGVACGVLLTVSDENVHKSMLEKRGIVTGNLAAEQKKIESFGRVRHIQDEMIRLAKESGWILIEQRTDPDPLDLVADQLGLNCNSDTGVSISNFLTDKNREKLAKEEKVVQEEKEEKDMPMPQ
mmetsp:Transcript_19043/g.43361  ORF Transcript_19043/g.43361 Transcript_19043/m.43361 type:complete len:276 (-) Transcript_19043:55-882(-)|eukprot:CAMPEP_0113299392 /NCGR_PEP_ID=MMETSP0010_2-20120614/1449_1 /TAXON_ID=216773 ORGANISM="Corethron hystrix, Strain 308" /NCGR_SAMPLE_ID=MMETSP0010_2 /ASSEMBLY_ACC=CAM_ASM_000155 /LENGTH=275 /DNA_ID=CAMNT_0000152625 /DNA_START=202 /DNA_END=1029 /DNA_ORIENTATION=+ /assembly_acc=CAM_ASM_000155